MRRKSVHRYAGGRVGRPPTYADGRLGPSAGRPDLERRRGERDAARRGTACTRSISPCRRARRRALAVGCGEPTWRGADVTRPASWRAGAAATTAAGTRGRRTSRPRRRTDIAVCGGSGTTVIAFAEQQKYALWKRTGARGRTRAHTHDDAPASTLCTREPLAHRPVASGAVAAAAPQCRPDAYWPVVRGRTATRPFNAALCGAAARRPPRPATPRRACQSGAGRNRGAVASPLRASHVGAVAAGPIANLRVLPSSANASAAARAAHPPRWPAHGR